MRAYILSFYYIVFGLLSIGIELKFKLIAKYFQTLLTFSGKGFWYLFLATIAFGEQWWSIFIAVLLISNGMLNSYLGCSPNAIIYKQNNNNNNNNNNVDNNNNNDDIDDVNIELGKLDENDESPKKEQEENPEIQQQSASEI